jgi:hypothetical protein
MSLLPIRATCPAHLNLRNLTIITYIHSV